MFEEDARNEDEQWFNTEEIEKRIETQSRERRADPLACLAEFLKTFWTDNTDKEVRLLWQHRIRLAPWYAEDMLYCLDTVIANPPPELGKFVRERGGVYLYHNDGSATLSNDAETLAWLRQIAQEFRAILQADQAPKEAEADE